VNFLLPWTYDARVTTPDPTAEAPISTERLDLVLLTGAWLHAYVEEHPLPELGFTAPDAFLAGTEHIVRLRAEQLAHDPAQEPWLLRAIVLRDSATALGYINFHASPDDRGMVEIGYQVLPAHRRRGYATEAAQGMWDWAARHGARVLRAAIAPNNVASLAMVHHAGFVEVGQQMDDLDGLELIFEKQVQT
jgi:ribosomal-protein-alanine N-acetyltransferase